MIRLKDASSIYDFVSHFEKNNKADKEKVVKSKKNIAMILCCFHLNLNCNLRNLNLRSYVENQAILEPILLYRASKCKQTKEQSSKDCL